MPSEQCPVSVLSHSVESCETCLRRPGIVFHNIIKFTKSTHQHNEFVALQQNERYPVYCTDLTV